MPATPPDLGFVGFVFNALRVQLAAVSDAAKTRKDPILLEVASLLVQAVDKLQHHPLLVGSP